MLHGLSTNKNDIIEKYKENDIYGNYLKAIVSKMVENTDIVVSNWSTYKSEFRSQFKIMQHLILICLLTILFIILRKD